MPKRVWFPDIDQSEWFPGFFSTWRRLREGSRDELEARSRMEDEHAGSLRDVTIGSIFWLLLAQAEWADGCLARWVAGRALDVLGKGPERIGWMKPRPLADREWEFERLERRFRGRGRSPASRPFGTRPFAPTVARHGDVLLVRDGATVRAALVVVGESLVRGRLVPRVAAYRWDGAVAPTPEELAAMTPLDAPRHGAGSSELTTAAVHTPSRRNCTLIAVSGVSRAVGLDPSILHRGRLATHVRRRVEGVAVLDWDDLLRALSRWSLGGRADRE